MFSGSLVGRGDERAVLEDVIGAARGGESRTAVLWGEAGIGKTALLDDLVASASGFRVIRAVGVESEMELAFAGVHQVCGPLLDRLDRLPDPQRGALAVVFGVVAGAAPDVFLVGLAVLSLLAGAAEDQPLLCVVDDAQWLDRASARVLAFVARRLRADRVALVFATREPGAELRGLPDLRILGLSDADSRALLAPVVRLLPDVEVLERIVDEAQGNPLALLELPQGLTATQLAGGLRVGSQALSSRIEESFVRRLDGLPDAARVLALVAAAEPTADPLLVWRAAARLGIAMTESADTMTDGLMTIDRRVTFRHPLVRSAVYRSAEDHRRRSVHLALAEVTDPESGPDRRAWHLAAAAVGPDEAIANELERVAVWAQARGGFGAEAALLERSVALSEDPTRRAERALAAAQASIRAGAFDAALSLLATARTETLDEHQRARAGLLRAETVLFQERGTDAPRLLLDAARVLEPLDPNLARDTYLEAWGAASFAGRFAREGSLHLVSLAARGAPRPAGPNRPQDLLLDGLALLFTEPRQVAVTTLRSAAAAFADGLAATEALLRWGWLATAAAVVLWEPDMGLRVATRCVEQARESGALSTLGVSCDVLAQVTALHGDLDGAQQLAADSASVAEIIGEHVSLNCALVVAALRGRQIEDLELIDRHMRLSTAIGQGNGVKYALWARSVVLNALGRYEEARISAEDSMRDTPEMFLSAWAASEMVEAATRVDRKDVAAAALERVFDHADSSGTDWALGVAARARALMSGDEMAEDVYTEAIERLGRAGMRPDLARSHLLYGEWLRRQDRRVQARAQLHVAHEMFVEIGMEAFAGRARGELLATGEKVRRRTPEALDELTSQERQIAVLARDGLSNPEIASRMFLSRRTVEWHLRKVFTKLGVSSRAELTEVLAGAQSGLAST